jgi:tRNA-specific 2-thiouridylase
MGRVLVAMSGGVDSSVAAALLAEAGVDVVGVTLHLWDASGEQKVGRCCAPEDREDARRTCDHLGVPHYVFDEREAFRSTVVEPFLDEYSAGRTPSPCTHCNRTVKLLRLVELADQLGATHVATGHYARLLRDPDAPASTPRLLRGADPGKDQSYFLFGVPAPVLRRMVFPLGAFQKDETRAEARRLGLPNADKPDSQELCFVPDGNVSGFVAAERGADRPGRVVDEDGRALATHGGLAGFTVGQRRGLGLPGGGPPRYVLRVLGDSGDVVVGAKDGLYRRRFSARDAAWPSEPPGPTFEGRVRIRHRHEPAPAEVRLTEGGRGFEVVFREPQRAITPGQASVIYRGDQVVGGGFIR